MAIVSPLGCYIYDTSNFSDRLCQIPNYVYEATKYDEPLRDHDLKSDKDLRGLIEAEDCYGNVGQVPSSAHDLTTVSAHKPTLDRVPNDLKSDDPASLELDLSSVDSIQSSRKGVSFDAHGLALSELYERSLSLESEPEPEPADDPESQKTSARPSKKRKKLSGDASDGGDKGGQGTEKDRDRQGAGGKDDGENEDGGSGGGRSSQPTKDPNKEKPRRWICPYSIAYPHLHHIPMFRHCWPGNMNKLYLWRDHLATHHSPIDPNANTPPQGDVARFHMNREQWRRVYNEIENGPKKRPRDKDESFSKWKNLFLEVWRIIFPQNQFPHLNEPSSPFHPDSGGVMPKAINAALLSTSAAFDATHRLAHASSQMSQTTSTDHADAVGPHPEIAPQDVPPETQAYTPATPPRTSGPAPIDLNAAQTASPVSFTIPVTLFPHGTQVTINFLPTDRNPQTDPQMGQLQVSLPTSFYPANFNQARLPVPPAMATPNGPANPTPPATDLDPSINPQPPTTPLESQGVSMRDIQGGPFVVEENAFMNDLMWMGQ